MTRFTAFKLAASIAALAMTGSNLVAADASKKQAPGKADKKKAGEAKAAPKSQYDDTLLQGMDHGPFYSGVFNGRDISLKSVAIKLDGGKAGVAFDTLTLRYADSWVGGFIQINGERTLGCNSTPIGALQISSTPAPGWAKGASFDAPRPRYEFSRGIDKKRQVASHKGIADGPLPKDWARWKGLYRNGEQVILSYYVGAADVLDQPGFERRDGLDVFTRTIEVSNASEPLVALVCDDPEGTVRVEGELATLSSSNATVHVAIATGSGAKLSAGDKGRVLLTIPKGKGSQKVVLAMTRVSDASTPVGKVANTLRGARKSGSASSLASLTRGGRPLWSQTISLKGTVPLATEAYVVDTIPVPERTANPWKSWIRPSGFDFFSDGRVALCSLSGDVWVISGVDSKLDKITWRRFASGLYQPLGLKIVKDAVYVLGRDQITRLRDLNGDGEADFYENFNNDVAISENYHEFCLNLETDSRGNFYFTKGGNLGQWSHAHHGCLLRVPADGSRIEVVATGLRAPNGMGMSPDDQVSSSDNEGNWVPVCRVNLMKPGGFYGHVFTAHRDPEPTDYDKPLFWIAYNQDNSSGGQVWVTSDKWGPFKGDMLHQAYGSCSLFETWKQEVDGQIQGGYTRFPLKFESGIMRGRFSPFDGQLYTVGLRVWQSNAAKDGAFHRVRYTGKPVVMPTQLNVRKNGIEITFTGALDPETAKDPGSYAVDQWNYRWSKEYGSKLYSVADPEKAIAKSLTAASGDPVEIKSVKLSADNKTVFLEFAQPVVPVMQQHVKFNLNDAAGKPLQSTELFHTINVVPSR